MVTSRFVSRSAFIADCPVRSLVDVVGNTWTIVVMHALREGPLRPSELREAIGGISAKVLTETLRRLERHGLLVRHSYAEAPPRVEYELTSLGRDLLGPIDALALWAEDHVAEIAEARLGSAAS